MRKEKIIVELMELEELIEVEENIEKKKKLKIRYTKLHNKLKNIVNKEVK